MADKRYATTYAELIDRTLQSKRFFSRKPLIQLIVLAWFGLSCWILVSDQQHGRLTSYDELVFALAKTGVISSICGIAVLLVWLIVRKK